MMSRRVLRFEVPVDDTWHRIELDGNIVHVDCRVADVVEFWTNPPVVVRAVHDGMGRLVKPRRYEETASPRHAFEFRVFGTGHPVDDGGYIGTALAPGGVLVWHLFAREVPR